MGLNLLFSRSSFDSFPKEQATQYNPKPTNYTIVKHSQIKNFLIILIRYHDCINYEGNKILVFAGIELEDLLLQEKVDPHFSEDKLHSSPIARFVPNDQGWKMAVSLCELMSSHIMTKVTEWTENMENINDKKN